MKIGWNHLSLFIPFFKTNINCKVHTAQYWSSLLFTIYSPSSAITFIFGAIQDGQCHITVYEVLNQGSQKFLQ